jgi:hypothetical protein
MRGGILSSHEILTTPLISLQFCIEKGQICR